jgi:hypothetical protein
VFLSYRFRDEDGELADLAKELIKSHCLECVTGENLAGERLDSGVSQRLRAADGLIALFLLPSHVDDFHTWIFNEYNDAIMAEKRAIAVVENGFAWPDLKNKEYVKFDRKQPLAAFLKLSQTIGAWRKEAGRTVLIRLRPPLAAHYAFLPDSTCRYRLKRQFQPLTDWVAVKPDRSANGIGFQVNKVPDDAQIEIEVSGSNGATSYFSVTDPQLLSVDLENASITPV